MPATFEADSSSASQLFFDFESSYCTGTALLDGPIHPRSLGVAEELASPADRQLSGRKTIQRTARQSRVEPLRQQAACHLQPSRTNVQPSAVVESPRRGTGEVRIGAVMLQLLKRYGITDEEIEEGLAEYARNHSA